MRPSQASYTIDENASVTAAKAFLKNIWGSCDLSFRGLSFRGLKVRLFNFGLSGTSIEIRPFKFLIASVIP